MDEMTATTLNNIVRTGWVSSVDVKTGTARVTFRDKGTPFVSCPLKVLQSQPLITFEKWVTEEEKENKWETEASYSSADRKLGLGESYKKGAPDIIKNKKTIVYEKTKGIPKDSVTCPLTGPIEEKPHRETITVYPWLPYIGQMVVCLFIPRGEGDGFVLGGL